MNFILRTLCVGALFLGNACSRIEWAHSVSKPSVLLPDGGRDAMKWSALCGTLGETDSCDVCSRLGWYEDAECDAFCPLADSTCVQVDPTLVGHWRLDEESGRTAVDSSSSRNDGTYAGIPTPTEGRFGRALEFHGPGALQASNDRIVIGDPADGSLDFGTSSFTYGLWVKVTSSASGYDIPFSKGAETTALPGFDLELGSGTWKTCVVDGDEAVCGAFSAEPIFGRWVHLMAVVDREARTLQLYIDGNPVSSAKPIPLTFGSVSSGISACIGASADGRHAFRGLIDDVRLYKRALGPVEVFQLQQ